MAKTSYPSIVEYTDGDDVTGYGTKHGSIASPQQPCPYDVTAGGGKSQKGGEPSGPFGQYLQSTPNALPIVGRDSMQANAPGGFGNTGGSIGGISTPMDTSKSEMPGVRGSDGSGPVSGNRAKISTPLGSPWGDSVG